MSMAAATESGETVLSLTPSAVAMAKQIRVKEGLADTQVLRVSVVGGGCSGFSYQIDFDERAQEGDVALEYDGLTVVVDPTSAQYLRGTQIDFVSSLTGGGFKFSNPKATHTCGCGSSFSA
jgi:iron-sulfur cluster assembly accessory protein